MFADAEYAAKMELVATLMNVSVEQAIAGGLRLLEAYDEPPNMLDVRVAPVRPTVNPDLTAMAKGEA